MKSNHKKETMIKILDSLLKNVAMNKNNPVKNFRLSDLHTWTQIQGSSLQRHFTSLRKLKLLEYDCPKRLEGEYFLKSNYKKLQNSINVLYLSKNINDAPLILEKMKVYKLKNRNENQLTLEAA